MPRDDAYVLDMLTAARKVARYTERVTRERFLSDDYMQSAVMRQVQVIGEAARLISADFQAHHPEIP